MLRPQRLLYGQDTAYNYTYCNPQLETSSSTSTAFPFGETVTTTLDAFYYPQLNCTPVKALLSSSQVYLTNGSRLDREFGVLNIDVSVFTTNGYMVNQARNQSQYVQYDYAYIGREMCGSTLHSRASTGQAMFRARETSRWRSVWRLTLQLSGDKRLLYLAMIRVAMGVITPTTWQVALSSYRE